MPIEINLPCKCPHCGEEFELFQSLAQDVLETVQTRLLAADTQAREEGRQTALAEARAAVQENVVQAQTQVETLQQQLINEQVTHAALQATLDQRMQNAMTQAQQQWQTQSNLEIQQRDNQIARLSHDLANLTSQLQQGHAQAQGEVGELAIENIVPPFVEIRGLFEIKVWGPEGVDAISGALQAAEDCAEGEEEVTLTCHYDGAPNYRVDIKAPDYPSAESVWEAAQEAASKKIGSVEGSIAIERL